MSGEIIVCYRRDDEPDAAALLLAALARRVGDHAVALLDDLLARITPKGGIAPESRNYDTLMVVAGRKWLPSFSSGGKADTLAPLNLEINRAVERGVTLVFVKVDSFADRAPLPKDFAIGSRQADRQTYLLLGMTHEQANKDVALVAEAVVNAAKRAVQASERAARRVRRRRAAAIAAGIVVTGTLAAFGAWPLIVELQLRRQLTDLARPGAPTASPPAADAVADCHRLAASPDDPARPMGFAGVKYEKIDTAKAIDACEQAYRLAPTDLTVTFELGRVYQSANSSDGPGLDRAYALYSAAAQGGYLMAMVNLANIMMLSASHWLDVDGGIAWLERAANAGVLAAMEALPHAMIQKESASAAEKARAVSWARKAVDQGSKIGMVDLGDLYLDGFGVDKDAAQAAQWYAKAADGDVAMAMVKLGALYQDGNGVSRDPAKAAEWYRKAAGRGNALGAFDLGLLYAEGEGVPQDAVKARELYLFAAKHDVAEAMIDLGQLYERGEGGPRDYAAALHWYEEADRHGLAMGANDIGWIYEAGLGVASDYRKAMSYYRKAADEGLALAMANVGWLYANGAPADNDKAYLWLYKAAQNGSVPGELRLGILYWKGIGVGKSYDKAAFLWKEAAQQGNAAAEAWLGIACFEGKGVPKNEAVGRDLLQEAASRGEDFAKQYLDRISSTATQTK